jgi:hypothetical protein
VGVRADEQLHLLKAQADLVHCPLELRQRARLVHPGVYEDDPITGRDRPGIAVRNARPRQRQPQAPQPRQDPFPSSELSLARHDGDTIFASQ